MSSTENNKKGGVMKKFIFFTYHFAFVTLTVNEDGDVVKMFWFQPGTSSRRLELTNPKILIDGAAFDGPYLPFSDMHWNLGGNFQIAAQDLFTFSIRPKYIPTCQECGVWPTFEWIGYWQNGRKFSQGFNRKCVDCEGLEEEPMPFVSKPFDLGQAIKDAIDEIVNSIDDDDTGDFV